MKRLAYITTMALVVALAGCKDDKPVQTVAWYQGHTTERTSALAECRGNAGEVAGTANCINAEKADAQLETSKRGHLKLDASEFGKSLKESK
ncbi:EexN family lipoprotein [Xanthomonas fragariae]|uniref:EexN family lipoprotein n=1 Tax=Xanthomonas fragariae TaxID=48664 RepID=UPI000D553231|nr:EexN family lipoprotein [Xanthomonas fragariae]MEA5249895.1 EexN family lipoprotein [Xanthomonas fragariae]